MEQLEKNVVVYGGGIAGGVLARRLARYTGVTLVDPLDYFEVPMAVPRNLVKPDFAEDAIVPFSAALPHVEHIRARLVEMTTDGGIVEDTNGRRTLLNASVSVLATGSRFSNELMRASDGVAVERKAFYRRYKQRLEDARRILIVGGGPIGVEVAGEITQTWPAKLVTLVEAGPRLLAGTSEEAAAFATSVLRRRGVEVLRGAALEGAGLPTSEVFGAGGEACTSTGLRIPYDLLLWCTGGRPNTAYMRPHFADKLNDMGRINVTPELRVVGQEMLFALGDITDLAENKMAIHIGGQVRVAEANVRALLAGRIPRRVYTAQTGNPLMAVALGSDAGVAHLPFFGVVRSKWINRKAKAAHMLVPRFRKAIGG